MCGIAGIILQPDTQLPDLRVRLAAMAQAMAHRGPDDQGIYVSDDGRVGFANRRLAIRDLSPAGHMPMQTADGAVTITYNGEIYNADELRQALATEGYHFRSQSDTEVILLGYRVWGKEIVRRLRGMFAFARHNRPHEPPISGRPTALVATVGLDCLGRGVAQATASSQAVELRDIPRKVLRNCKQIAVVVSDNTQNC